MHNWSPCIRIFDLRLQGQTQTSRKTPPHSPLKLDYQTLICFLKLLIKMSLVTIPLEKCANMKCRLKDNKDESSIGAFFKNNENKTKTLLKDFIFLKLF